MDAPTVDPGAHRAALAALRQTNDRLRVEQRLVRHIEGLLPTGPATVLDVGAGGGGLPAALQQHASRSRRDRRVIALDRSPFALSVARNGFAPGRAGYVAGDALRLPFPNESIDVVACSLLLHHFDPEDAVRLLREASRVCRVGVVVGDLDRTVSAWMATVLVTRLVSRSHIFHVDGPRSVRAAYRPAEARELAREAGLARAEVRTCFPFRWLLIWRRAGA